MLGLVLKLKVNGCQKFYGNRLVVNDSKIGLRIAENHVYSIQMKTYIFMKSPKQEKKLILEVEGLTLSGLSSVDLYYFINGKNFTKQCILRSDFCQGGGY